MRIGDVVNVKGKWVRWEDPDSDEWIELLIKPKSGGLEKKISNKTVTTKVGKRGKMEVHADSRLALKMLIEGCLLDWRGIYDGEEPWPFTPENAMTLLWDGPSGLLEFFEDQAQQTTVEADEGNAEASDS